MKVCKTPTVASRLARSLCLACGCLFLSAGLSTGTETPVDETDIFRLLTGQRLILGTVEEIRSQEVRVNIGDVMPRFLSLKQAGDKHHITPRVGDLLVLVMKDQNNVIEYHLYGEESWHVLIHGKLLESLSAGQTWTLIQDPSGKVKIIPIDEDAREKFPALPVGKDATFLLDSSYSIIDVSWESGKAPGSR